MKYNKASFSDTVHVARVNAKKWQRETFVFATALGWLIDSKHQAFDQDYFRISPTGEVFEHVMNLGTREMIENQIHILSCPFGLNFSHAKCTCVWPEIIQEVA